MKRGKQRPPPPPPQTSAMLLNTLLIVTLSSQCVWARKSEPSLSEGDTVGLFRGSDKYDFAIEIPAAGMECFWHFAHQSGSFYLTYMVRIFTVNPRDWVSSCLQVEYVCNLMCCHKMNRRCVCAFVHFRLITLTFKVT